MAERDRRLADYEKVSQLGSKMEGELTFQRQKIESLKTEISKISDIEGVRASLEAEKQRNEKERDQLLIIRDTLREEVQQHLSATHDAKKASLHENDTATQLAALEQRLRHIEGTNFHLKEYIATKNAESDYKPLAKQVTELMDEMNQQIIKIMAIPPAR
ncbi:uncharacterized protein EV422DRAFT_137152 [Fimicolochytrium jonesii]|uniref:uncharacterized protein n=1 Tax=Fimicolochytrium jonesii TaxID=1396493 RepID=UPI0022FEA5BD|nr:uncharacterized protein EV422DRAFT_137152 [Fimicolochytrium jonesii]KAI8825691.1 hypothetical protein EV422DRAFT_137152 [Fimicolochytrium jonesii]